MKPIKRTLVMLLCLSLLSFSFPGFAERDKPLIGIIQVIEHTALDQAREGFLAALADNGLKDGEQITVDYRNAQDSRDVLASIADHFVASQVDLVLAIATSSAETMAGKTETIPIIGTAITDYVEPRLILSNEEPGSNVSGVSDMGPVKEQIELMVKMVPDLKTIGLLYTASEINSVVQIRVANETISSLGLEATEITVHSSNDVQQAVTAMLDRCDAIYIPTDNTFASAMPVVYDVAVAAKMPVFCGDIGMVEGGGVATLGFSYYDLGYRSGLMAYRVLNGEDISKMPIEWGENPSTYVNKTVCDAIGLAIPEDLLPYAVEP